MRTEKIIWGIILVFAGAILLLQNFGVIDFYWQVIFRFWPIILILIGANLLLSRENSQFGAIVSILLTLLALGFIAYQGIVSTHNDAAGWLFNKDDNIFDEKVTTNVFTEEYNQTITKAVLNISGGATLYVLEDTTNNLFDADVKKNFGKYSLLKTFGDSTQTLNFKMKGNSKWDLNNKGNRAILKLNRNPVWDINLEMGAGATDFDLSAFKINSLSIKGGAASFEIKLGELTQNTNVSVETGVSEIEISVPRSAACKIYVESGLSSNNFKGFKKQSDGTYTSENFNESSRAIVLNLKGGLSKFEVKQY